MNDHLLLAYEFDGAGGGKPLDEDTLWQDMNNDRLTWAHMDANLPETRKCLEEEIANVDPFVVDALLAQVTRPRVTEIEDGAIIILRGVNLNKDADPEDMISVRMWLDPLRIISLQKRQLQSVLDVEQKIKTRKGPKDAGHFVCMLITRMFEHMEPVLTEMEGMIDDIEEKILENPEASLRASIVAIRKQAILLRRHMAPQKDAIGRLRVADLSWLNNTHRRNLQENHDRVTRYLEGLDAIRERAQIVKDELAGILADRLNKNMYLLSVIAAIFLPLSFFTGLLGINVGGIPGAENKEAFLLFCGFLAAIVGLQIYLFKKLKWF